VILGGEVVRAKRIIRQLRNLGAKIVTNPENSQAFLAEGGNGKRYLGLKQAIIDESTFVKTVKTEISAIDLSDFNDAEVLTALYRNIG